MMMPFVARDAPTAAASATASAAAAAAPPLRPPRPPNFDTSVYLTVPLFNKRADLLAIIITFMIFAWICALFRLYIRFRIVRAPWWDDFFMVISLICTTLGSIFLVIAPNYGFGQSIYDLTFSEIQDLMKIIYMGSFPYPLSFTLIKIALLFQYLRIFKEGSKLRLLCKWMIVVIAIWGLFNCLVQWLPCFPVAAYWDFSITNAKCWGLGSHNLEEFMAYYVSQAVTSSALDFIIFILPVRLYFQPDTPTRTRIAMTLLFIMGICVNLCSLWRMANVIQIKLIGEGTFDPTWYSPTAAGLSNLEVFLAVSCAAMPVFWPTIEGRWNRIFVTHEVSVTREYGRFPSKAGDVELQSSMSSDKNGMVEDPNQMMPDGWEPFVGDETTGLGESETVIESQARSKRVKIKRALREARQSLTLPSTRGVG